jgi:hypothetical protein
MRSPKKRRARLSSRCGGLRVLSPLTSASTSNFSQDRTCMDAWMLLNPLPQEEKIHIVDNNSATPSLQTSIRCLFNSLARTRSVSVEPPYLKNYCFLQIPLPRRIDLGPPSTSKTPAPTSTLFLCTAHRIPGLRLYLASLGRAKSLLEQLHQLDRSWIDLLKHIHSRALANAPVSGSQDGVHTLCAIDPPSLNTFSCPHHPSDRRRHDHALPVRTAKPLRPSHGLYQVAPCAHSSTVHSFSHISRGSDADHFAFFCWDGASAHQQS